ncbi:hypothetical protein C8R43DRAFT_1240285 [Mycena crocata]|nr:hypothetical protein C8R43DRAFT_1240285 [Mycena crocata]
MIHIATLVASPSHSWAQPCHHAQPLLPSSAWNMPASTNVQTARKEKPRLRLALESPSSRADKLQPPVASTSQLPQLPSVPTQNTRGRRRSPSFTAPPNTPRSACSSPISFTSAWSSPPPSTSAWTPSPAPSLSRPAQAATPAVPLAPTPFHARHYPTSDARARLLARTLLNRIHAVGRPRSLYCSSSSKSSAKGRMCDGYKSECGSRGYTPSRLSECVVA